jgi:hypothetical protein
MIYSLYNPGTSNRSTNTIKHAPTFSIHNPNIKPHVRHITQASLVGVAGKAKWKAKGSGTTTRKKECDRYGII